MALRSGLFKGDAKLESAAVSDAAHITSGSSGEHVRKIQIALNTLDDARLGLSGIYDRQTADAVLNYKTKRNIVNLTYQKSADNIVGKMTITALDAEMFLREQAPIFLLPVHPVATNQNLQFLAFERFSNASASGFVAAGTPAPAPPVFPPSPPPPSFPGGFNLLISGNASEVIIPPGGSGSLKVMIGAGGQLICDQNRVKYGENKNLSKVVQIPGEAKIASGVFAVNIKGNDETHNFIGEACGETEIRAELTSNNVTKSSNTLRVLCLIDKALVLPLPRGDYNPDPNFKSGRLTIAGTPLNPLPGRKINVFGEGETPGFEDYSALIDFCSHTFSNGNGPPGQLIGHRPWTNDPRKKGGPGIDSKTVSNISCRGSFISNATIDEFLRIGAPGCRLTYAEASGRSQSDKLKKRLGSMLREEGVHDSNGFAVIFELP